MHVIWIALRLEIIIYTRTSGSHTTDPQYENNRRITDSPQNSLLHYFNFLRSNLTNKIGNNFIVSASAPAPFCNLSFYSPSTVLAPARLRCSDIRENIWSTSSWVWPTGRKFTVTCIVWCTVTSFRIFYNSLDRPSNLFHNL